MAEWRGNDIEGLKCRVCRKKASIARCNLLWNLQVQLGLCLESQKTILVFLVGHRIRKMREKVW